MNRLSFCASLLVFLLPSLANASCGDGQNGQCAVGVYGQGGTSSGGQAQGGFISRPSIFFEGATYKNSGNNFAGRINVTGAGSQSGSAPGSGATVNGHATGFLGDFSGQCPADDLFWTRPRKNTVYFYRIAKAICVTGSISFHWITDKAVITKAAYTIPIRTGNLSEFFVMGKQRPCA